MVKSKPLRKVTSDLTDIDWGNTDQLIVTLCTDDFDNYALLIPPIDCIHSYKYITSRTINKTDNMRDAAFVMLMKLDRMSPSWRDPARISWIGLTLAWPMRVLNYLTKWLK